MDLKFDLSLWSPILEQYLKKIRIYFARIIHGSSPSLAQEKSVYKKTTFELIISKNY